MNTAWLLGGLIFSSVGLGYFMYGKSQQSASLLICGLALMIYPYFVPNLWVLIAVGVGLIAIPLFAR